VIRRGGGSTSGSIGADTSSVHPRQRKREFEKNAKLQETPGLLKIDQRVQRLRAAAAAALVLDRVWIEVEAEEEEEEEPPKEKARMDLWCWSWRKSPIWRTATA
jgi:hypothetical protein